MADERRTTTSGETGGGFAGMLYPGFMRRISWGAVIAGAVVALVVHLMLSLLGVGIGAMQIGPGAEMEGLGMGAAIWWIISLLISLFIGGWFAGYLAGMPERRDGALHGVVTWGLAMFVSVFLLATAVGTVTAGALNVVEQGMAAMDGEELMDPQMLEQVQEQVGEQEAEQMMAEAEEVADEAAEVVAQAGIWGFIGMLLAAIVAGLGGMLGAPQDAPRTHLPAGGGDYGRRGGEGPGYGPEGSGGAGYSREPGRYHYEAGQRERHEAGPQTAEDYERAERERAERQRIERERTQREDREGGPPNP